jgi:ribbon-helix-helix CopG family protein
MIPDELAEKLRAMAHQRRRSIGSLVREALEEKAKSHSPKPTCFGIADSGFADTSERAGEEWALPR